MGSRFALGKKAIAECDVCGQRYRLAQLKPVVVKTKVVNIMACPECWDPDHPQLQLGMYPIDDPQALRNPRPDNGLIESRDIQWGWNPIGLNNPLGLSGLINTLLCTGQVGTVTVSTTED